MNEINSSIMKYIPENPIDIYPETRDMDRNFILHIGPTNSGKTHGAIEALEAASSGVYLAPLRLLAYECYEKLNAAGIPCSLITGEEEKIEEGATHVASTVELLNLRQKYDVAVIDEAQMIADEQRGGAWTAAMLGVKAKEVHVCAPEYAKPVLTKLINMCGDKYKTRYCERSVPLECENHGFSFPQSIQKNDALIVFSRRDVIRIASELQSMGIRCSVVYGGLPYEARQNEVKRFINGETDIVVATDAIGMGMNLPIRRVVFLDRGKFDGKEMRRLVPEEVQQIAGRAGRQGIYDVGYYTSDYAPEFIKDSIETKVPNLTHAVLQFSENLVNVEGNLSEIMERWKSMEPTEGFKKADISEQIFKCRCLEEYTDDKELIYGFSTIPFNMDNDELYDVWMKAFFTEMKGEHLYFEYPQYSCYSLNEMEQAYKYCDMMYSYNKKFCNGEQLGYISACKKIITEEINERLVQQSKVHERKKLEPVIPEETKRSESAER